MKKLLEFLVSSIVQNPNEVKIDQESDGNTVTLAVKVNPADIKLVIGKGGKTIKALRELVKIKGIKEKKRVDIKIQ